MSTVSSKASKKRRFNVSPEARTKKFLCEPTEERNDLLITGSSAVYYRFIIGTRIALCSWLPTSGTTPFCLCKHISCKARPEIIIIIRIMIIIMYCITYDIVSIMSCSALFDYVLLYIILFDSGILRYGFHIILYHSISYYSILYLFVLLERR